VVKKVHKKKSKSAQKKCTNRGGRIGKQEKRRLDILTWHSKGLNVYQISKRRGTSTRATFKQFAKLREKGYLTPNNMLKRKAWEAVNFSKYTPQKVHKKNGKGSLVSDVHKLVLRFDLLNKPSDWDIKRTARIGKFQGYKDWTPKGNLGLQSRYFIDDYMVLTSSDCVRIAMKAGYSLEGEDLLNEFLEGINYILGFIVPKVENDLKVQLVKPRKQNIKLSEVHVALRGVPLADYLHERKITIFHLCEDGIRLQLEASKGLAEFEFKSPSHALDDATYFSELIRDWNENKPLFMSDFQRLLGQAVLGLAKASDMVKVQGRANEDTAKGLSVAVDLLNNLLKSNGTKPKPSLKSGTKRGLSEDLERLPYYG